MSHVTVGVARTLLEQETEPLRFERFCVDLISKLEGDVHIVTTSSNYDRARDGISVGKGAVVILMCSLTDGLDSKALADAKKLARGLASKKMSPDSVYFCSSQRFTEAKADQLEMSMRTALSLKAGFKSVTALSGLKLAQLGSKHAALFDRHYPSELNDIRRVLAESPDANESEHALRLALSTTASDDAAVIREDVWRALLRLHLAKGEATASELAARVSNYLRLASAIGGPARVKVVVARSLHAASRSAGSGFRTTSPTGFQFLVPLDQRSGLRLRACS